MSTPAPRPERRAAQARAVAAREIIVRRYTPAQKVNHWITALLFILLALSGLAMFSPFLFFLTGLFGGGQAARGVHPWLGLALAVSFLVLFARFWRLNLPNRDDVAWTRRLGDVLRNRHQGLPPLGKYNAGQKLVFWGQSLFILLMLLTGLVIWDQYFATYTGIGLKRIALLVHSVAAILAILLIIVHVYAAIWVRGTGRAMVRGSVSGGWALRHHARWFHERARAGEVAPQTDAHER